MTTPSIPSDPPRRTAAIGTSPFAYTDEGTGPAIVAVHGLPGSVRDYRWLGAALPPSVRFVRLDLPGFGGTPLATAPDPGLDARGAFVAAAIAALGLERCVVIGHSMGGGVALSAAVQVPGRVAAAGLLASVGLRPHRGFRRVVGQSALARAVDLPLVRAPLLASLKVMFRSLGFSAQTTEAEIAHTMRCVAATDFEIMRRNTQKLAVPTLFAWSEDDALIERAVFEEHAAALPTGPRLSWPDGGHNLQKSYAVELAEALAALANG